MEWVFFLVELTTIAVYYSTWGRIDPKLHLTVGWVYAVASAFTLIIINGILTFMLTPGDTWLAVAGTGHEASKFWYAFFNPTYWPSLFLRTCVCCSLAGIWALITASRIDGDKQPELKTSMVQWSVKWLVPSFVAMPFLMIWYYRMVPAFAAGTAATGHRHHQRRNVFDHHAHGAGHHHDLGHHRRRRLLPRLSQSARLQSLPRHGRAAAGADRHRQRANTPARCCASPTLSAGWMYSNGVRVPYVARINQEGYLAHSNVGLE